ncbi:CRP-like cAMP-binding protein [Caulobacter ginsengisoli]|uniref:CRP-like cAMP-binding protein n=1 Tax=Caulobacter ginsengisoli TaxID=400775 RepID=A0ABU0IX70_9CAUL|nr:Crp/Fnr family transcriptional regulator [Caulobacter ginsengisoli]MDQ0466594.1 CRP-like cAMP-binding protein [Caulobacter ginsengisoli]
MNFRNAFLAAVDVADLGVISPHLLEISLQRGDAVLEVGDMPAHVVFPGSAVISVVTVMEDGRCVETATIGHESGVAMLDAAIDEPVKSRVFTQITGSAIRLPASVFRERLTQSPNFLRLALRHARANARQTEQHVACNMLHDLDRRLAKWLLMTADRVGGDRFMLTQDYMAVMTGAQRTTVSATAARLKTAGLVAYTRGQVNILDRAGLERRACECYGEIRTLFDGLRPSGAARPGGG